MADSTIKDRMIVLLDEARQEAYARGWQDAIRSIMEAATNVAPAALPDVLARDARDAKGHALISALRKTRAPWGTSTKAANLALDRAGPHGIDLASVLSAAEELGHPVVESSARSILNDMATRGEIERREDGRWHRVFKQVISTDHRNGGSADQDHPAASDPFNKGGSDDRTALAH